MRPSLFMLLFQHSNRLASIKAEIVLEGSGGVLPYASFAGCIERPRNMFYLFVFLIHHCPHSEQPSPREPRSITSAAYLWLTNPECLICRTLAVPKKTRNTSKPPDLISMPAQQRAWPTDIGHVFGGAYAKKSRKSSRRRSSVLQHPA